jgi:hypothetical protein
VDNKLTDRLFLILTAFVAFSACASHAEQSAPDQDSTTTWSGTGILVYTGEEMHLFKDQRTLGVYPNKCVTLVANNKSANTTFKKYDRKLVKAEGKSFPWPTDVHSIKIGGLR